MRTFEAHQRDIEASRYTKDLDDSRSHNPYTKEGAQDLVSTHGGKKAARLAIAKLWLELGRDKGRYGLTVEEVAIPARILLALCTLGICQKARNEVDLTDVFSLTPYGMKMASNASRGESK